MPRKVAEISLLPVAQIVKSYDTTGEVAIKYTSGLLQDYPLKEPVFLYFDGMPVPFFITALRNKGNSGAILKFETVNDFRHSEELLRKEIYLPATVAAGEENRPDEGDSMALFLIGCKVQDQNKRVIGTISNYLDIPNNPCIEVSRSCGEGDTCLLPFHEELILQFDPAKRLLRMNVPSGLLELYFT